MMKTVSLSDNWRLRQEPLACGKGCAAEVSGREDGWLEVERVPCDVHVPLIASGAIKEPTVANNCFDCEWIEDRSWWFKKEFSVDPSWLLEDNAELFIGALDCMADIFLNGEHIGFQRSAMYAFRKDVRNQLRAGANELLIRLTAGTDRISRDAAAASAPWVSCEWRGRDSTRGDDRRGMLRKPQYVFGWDQSLRIATCGIMGDVRLELCSDTVIRDVAFATESLEADGSAVVRVTVEADSLRPIYAPIMEASVALSIDGTLAVQETREHFGLAGVNYTTFRLRVPNAKLWWPNGAGEQNLYDLSVTLKTERSGKDSRSIRVGIRAVQVCHDRVNDVEREFYLRVNGVRMFCKGFNWIPCDALYSRTSAAFREGQLKSAAGMNCNMVRAWGGNAYEPDDFYDVCDRLGLMVFQEFAFACAGYPDNLDWFRSDAEGEAVYQVRRLRSHPSVVIWSGNGECTSHLVSYKGMDLFAGPKKPEFTGGTQLFNYIFPRVLHELAPEIYYWTASPYGGESSHAKDERGDQHKWISLSLQPQFTQDRMTPEHYDGVNCKFVSEFGYFGPPSRAEVERYCGGEPQMGSDVWKNHTNTFECGITNLAITKHYLDTDGLPLDDFLLYGGLFQGIALEYALDSLRHLRHNSGALVWCLNDNFGEIGFSVTDHLGRFKPAAYFVRRAFAHVRLMLRREGNAVGVWCTNDTPVKISIPIECGYVSFEGKKSGTALLAADVEPFCKAKLIATLPADGFDLASGMLYASSSAPGVNSATFRAHDFRRLQIPRRARLTVSDIADVPEGLAVTVAADIYAHAVHFGLPADIKLSDDYFDLLPGESKRVTIHSKSVAPHMIQPGCVFVGDAQ